MQATVLYRALRTSSEIGLQGTVQDVLNAQLWPPWPQNRRCVLDHFGIADVETLRPLGLVGATGSRP